MSDEDPIDRSLLDAARPGLGPTPEQRARMKKAVVVAATTTAASGVLGIVARWAGTTGAKLAIGTAAVALGGGLWAWQARHDASTPSHAVAPIEAPSREVPERPAMPPEPSQEPTEPSQELAEPSQEPTEPSQELAEPSPEPTEPSEELAEPAAVAPTREVRHAATSSPVAWPTAESLAEEAALVREAERALRAHDTDGALRVVADHERRFRRGALVEERELVRARALCVAHAPRAAATAAAFRTRYPTSVHRAALDGDCPP